MLDAAGVKLLAVSIGTSERAKDFVKETQFPIENLYAVRPARVTTPKCLTQSQWNHSNAWYNVSINTQILDIK